GAHAVPHLVRLRWQGLQQWLFLLPEILQPVSFFSGKGLLVMLDALALDGSIQRLDRMKLLVTQRSVNALIGELHFILYMRFVFRLTGTCRQQNDIIMQRPLAEYFGKYGFVTAASGHQLPHVVGFERNRNAAKVGQTGIQSFDHLGNGGIGKGNRITVTAVWQ